MKKPLTLLFAIAALLMPAAAKNSQRSALGTPDMEKIARESTDPSSAHYYPKLHAKFMASDTTMTPEDFQFFYYGTMFQEDYDPYREPVNPELLQELQPIYAKEKRTRADRGKMLDYAIQVLEDNPIDLRQLTNRIFVYEQNRKTDLARIWQYKLNHLLLVIAASGNGSDPENAIIVVYPQHEYDFLNLSGMTAISQRFEPPHFDYIEAQKTGSKNINGYYFNIEEMLNQYFDKHPSELPPDAGE